MTHILLSVILCLAVTGLWFYRRAPQIPADNRFVGEIVALHCHDWYGVVSRDGVVNQLSLVDIPKSIFVGNAGLRPNAPYVCDPESFRVDTNSCVRRDLVMGHEKYSGHIEFDLFVSDRAEAGHEPRRESRFIDWQNSPIRLALDSGRESNIFQDTGYIQRELDLRLSVVRRKLRGILESYIGFSNPRSLAQNQSSMSNLIRVSHRTPHEYSGDGIGGENQQGKISNPKLYCLTSLFFGFLGSLLLSFGWWYAHYGKGPVWWGMTAVCAGFIVTVWFFVLFGLHCCQYP